jgi:hypothetical protein
MTVAKHALGRPVLPAPGGFGFYAQINLIICAGV